MNLDAVVMAAGEGRRMRPLTERWPKAILPIDGRPVLATLLRELSAAGLSRIWLVVGHLQEQVRALAGDGRAFGIELYYTEQPTVLGSGDAVARAIEAGASPPVVVVAADTMFGGGDVARFVTGAFAADVSGAIAVRRDPPPSGARPRIRVVDGLVERIGDDDESNPLSGAPLWLLHQAVADRLRCDREPYELENSFRSAMAAGDRIAGVEIGKTRDLTDPLDLVEENFPYLTL